MAEPYSKQTVVLAHLLDVDTTTVRAASEATGLTEHEARAMLKALERRGYAYERLGSEGADGNRDVPRGRYVITPSGRRQLRRFRRFTEASPYEVGEYGT